MKTRRNSLIQGAVVLLIIGIVLLILNQQNIPQPPAWQSLRMQSGVINGHWYFGTRYYSAKNIFYILWKKNNGEKILFLPVKIQNREIDFNIRRANFLDFWSGFGIIPKALVKLKPGDNVTIWDDSGGIWQMSHDGNIVFSYQQAIDVIWRQKHEVDIFAGIFLVLGILILTRGRQQKMHLH